MSKKLYFTKIDSNIFYGFASLMMIYHHLFYPGRFSEPYISVLKFGTINIESNIAYFCKLCVAIYAFSTGYGLYSLAESRELSNPLNIFKMIFSKLFRFYIQYWIVFLLVVPLNVLLLNEFNMRECILNMLGVSHTYNYEWWYVTQYIKMLLIFPVLYIFINKIVKKGQVYVWLLVIYVSLSIGHFSIIRTIESFTGQYIIVMFAGMLIAKYKDKLKIDKYFSNTFIIILYLLAIFLGRRYLNIYSSGINLDFIFVTIFLICLKSLVDRCTESNVIIKGLVIFGGRSTYIWLTHTFICFYYFEKIIAEFKISTLIFIAVILSSTLIATILNKLYIKIISGMRGTRDFFKLKIGKMSTL